MGLFYDYLHRELERRSLTIDGLEEYHDNNDGGERYVRELFKIYKKSSSNAEELRRQVFKYLSKISSIKYDSIEEYQFVTALLNALKTINSKIHMSSVWTKMDQNQDDKEDIFNDIKKEDKEFIEFITNNKDPDSTIKEKITIK